MKKRFQPTWKKQKQRRRIWIRHKKALTNPDTLL